ncbi:hypothetical protein HYPSUDRAFT_202941 [Hypholoma sublateritium FD-334 SS-4]|uniref:Uncharacterized protein n=1 Tax=Hypholoma sublateritium (strain FD-334 SS-4) TaxID=945553 RepID=A0A0D2NRH1_HYPSF|nr:hypothetical protein HYPSUDRAFT_202941 [Hypholoma sublateritium FD-334 SS-4]
MRNFISKLCLKRLAHGLRKLVEHGISTHPTVSKFYCGPNVPHRLSTSIATHQPKVYYLNPFDLFCVGASIDATTFTTAIYSSSMEAYHKITVSGEIHPDKSNSNKLGDSQSQKAGATVAASTAANGSRVGWNDTGAATSASYPEDLGIRGLPTQEIRGRAAVSTAADTSSGHGYYYEDTTSNNASPDSETSSFSLVCTSEDLKTCPGPINYCEIPGICPVLSPHLMALGDEAILSYESVREEQISNLPDKPSDPHRPFSSFSCEGLERYFNALVDARAAVELRKRAAEVDIGDCLRILDLKLSLYCKDDVFLESAAYEEHLIKHESSVRNLGIDFWALQCFRSRTQDPAYGASFLEKNSAINYSIEQIVQKKRYAREVVDRFLADPHSLTEHRLPFF